MNTYRVIESFLGQPGFYRHGESLDNFGGVHADNMQTDNLLTFTFDDKFHHGQFVPPGKRVLHGSELGQVDIDLADVVDRVLFAVPHAADRRL